jgi:TonB family protein
MSVKATIAGLLIGLGMFLSSQVLASTVTIEAAEGGAPTAVAAMPLEITETDYPLEPLLANQEGKVTLEFSVTAAGHATNLRLLSSSGLPLLDQKAAQLAGTRWTFQPLAGAVRLSVDWKLPLENAGDYTISIPPHPSGATEPKAVSSHAVVADDYPPLSIRAGEQGIAAVRYLIKSDGSIGDVQVVQTSGIKRIDDAAVQMIRKRWKFQPATVEGKPTEWWNTAITSFQMLPDLLDKRTFRCYPKPAFAEEKVTITAALIVGSTPTPFYRTMMDRWTSVTPNGDVAEVLIATKAGLKRPTGTLLQLLKGSGYKKPDAVNGCWYYDPVLAR